MIAMLDTLEWPVVFLGCMLAGVVPVAVEHAAHEQRPTSTSCCVIHAREALFVSQTAARLQFDALIGRRFPP